MASLLAASGSGHGQKPKAILDEDKVIEKYPLGVKEADVHVVGAGDLFEK